MFIKKASFDAIAKAVPQTDAFQTIIKVVPNSKISARKKPVSNTLKLINKMWFNNSLSVNALPWIILNCSPKSLEVCSSGKSNVITEKQNWLAEKLLTLKRFL